MERKHAVTWQQVIVEAPGDCEIGGGTWRRSCARSWSVRSCRPRRTGPTSAVGDWTTQGQASAGVELADGDLEFGQCADRLRRLADGEDPHARAQADLECRAAGDDLVDLDDGSATVLSAGRSRTPNPATRALPVRGELGDRDGGRLGLAVAIEGQRDLGADIQTGGQVSQPGRVGDLVVGELDDHVVRLEPDLLGRAAGLDVDDQSTPVVGQA